MSDSHILDSLKVLSGMMAAEKLQDNQWRQTAEVPPDFVFPEPVSMLPTMQAHLDILSQSLGLPPVGDK